MNACTAFFTVQGLAVQGTMKEFIIACTTLQRHLEDHDRTGNEQFLHSNKCVVWTAFSTDEEDKLIG
jgi:hypothetical protein